MLRDAAFGGSSAEGPRLILRRAEGPSRRVSANDARAMVINGKKSGTQR
jgi:hypothetical protein